MVSIPQWQTGAGGPAAAIIPVMIVITEPDRARAREREKARKGITEKRKEMEIAGGREQDWLVFAIAFPFHSIGRQITLDEFTSLYLIFQSLHHQN